MEVCCRSVLSRVRGIRANEFGGEGTAGLVTRYLQSGRTLLGHAELQHPSERTWWSQRYAEGMNLDWTCVFLRCSSEERSDRVDGAFRQLGRTELLWARAAWHLCVRQCRLDGARRPA